MLTSANDFTNTSGWQQPPRFTTFKMGSFGKNPAFIHALSDTSTVDGVDNASPGSPPQFSISKRTQLINLRPCNNAH